MTVPQASLARPGSRATRATLRRSEPGWDFLLIAIALYIVFAVGRLHVMFPLLKAAQPATVFSLLVPILYLTQMRGIRRLEGLKNPITKLVLAELVIVAASVPFSIYKTRSFMFLVDEYARTAIICIVIAGAVRSIKDVERIAMAYAGSAVFYATVVALRKGITGGRLGGLYTYDGNDFALYIVMALPLVLYQLTQARKPRERALALFSIAVLGLIFMRTGSRGGFLGLIGVMGFLLFFNKAVTVRTRTMVVAGLVALVMVFGRGWYLTQMQTLLNPNEDYNMTSPTGRKAVWKRGIGYMLSRPLTGVGANNFETAEGHLSEIGTARAAVSAGWKWSVAHSSYVEIGAEIGVLGIIVFLALLYQSFRWLYRTGVADRKGRDPPAPERVRGLCMALAATLIGFAIAGAFVSQGYSDFLYVVLGLVAGLMKLTRFQKSTAATTRVPHVKRRRRLQTASHGAGTARPAYH